jgi:hypothetical protein
MAIRISIESTHYGVFLQSCVTSLPLAYISSSALYSPTTSSYVLSLGWETKIHTHTKLQMKLRVHVMFMFPDTAWEDKQILTVVNIKVIPWN